MSASFVADGDPAKLVVPPMVPSAEQRLHAESLAEWQPDATAAERAIEAAYRDGVTAGVQAVIAALREPIGSRPWNLRRDMLALADWLEQPGESEVS